MPLTAKGSEIEANMKKEYGSKKGESVFYASKNKGTISGVDSAGDKAMSNQTPGLAKAFDAMNALMDGCTRLAGSVDSFVSRRADAVSYSSSAYDLSLAGENAFKSGKSLASVNEEARSAGLNKQQTEIMVGGWKGAREDKKSGRADGAMDHESAAAWHTNQSSLPENKFYSAQHKRAAELHMAAVEAHTARDPAAKDKSEYAMKFSKANKLDRK